MTAPMTPTRSGSPTGSTGAQAGVRTRPRDALGVSPSDLLAPAGAVPVDAAPPSTDAIPVQPDAPEATLELDTGAPARGAPGSSAPPAATVGSWPSGAPS